MNLNKLKQKIERTFHVVIERAPIGALWRDLKIKRRSSGLYGVKGFEAA
jgi:hypothetical protein